MKKEGAFKTTQLQSKRAVNENTCWLTFEDSLDAQPGQFVMIWLPECGEKPFSIVAMDPFSLLVVDVGSFSHRINRMKVGETIWFKGALGQGFELEGERILLVGGGYGAAPLYPLAGSAIKQGISVQVLLGAASSSGLLLVDAFKGIGCDVDVSTEDASQGFHGLVTVIVEEAIRDSHFDGLYACGPTGMLSALGGIATVNKLNYQLSWEAQMRCGMGLCGSCEVPVLFDPVLPPGWLACYDGPVFCKRWPK